MSGLGPEKIVRDKKISRDTHSLPHPLAGEVLPQMDRFSKTDFCARRFGCPLRPSTAVSLSQPEQLS